MANPDPNASLKGLTGDEKIVTEAQKRFKRCETWESVARKRWIEDEKFVNGDSDNMYQWPSELRTARGIGGPDERPCLTINKTEQHCLQIINDARQNKTAIKFRPVGGGATYEAAQVIDGLVRHIEYISDAQSAYATATRHQVQSGLGYLRVVTEYAAPDSFDQEIYIRRVKNPLNVYVDPDFAEADGSDMRFAFVFTDVPRDEFEARYPKAEGTDTTLNNTEDWSANWMTADHVRVAEYFRRSEKTDTLYHLKDPESGESKFIRASDVETKHPHLKAVIKELAADPETKSRKITEHRVEWFKIAGHKIIERRDWPGSYIPIIRIPGQETVIDGELDRKGHVRALKDPQRMLNYNASGQVEVVALQTKTPWKAPVAAIEGYQTYWETANVQNYSVLPWNHVDDAGNPIPAPERTDPPQASNAFQIGMETAEKHMMMASGQYQADFGANGNERSGVAIEKRQRQGSTATYHFIDHLAMALRFTGKIILDLIPKIYDTKRVLKIMAEDGSSSDVLLDPAAAQGYLEQQQKNADTAKQVIFNPNVGRYDVTSDVGPDYQTRRQESFTALSQIAGSNQELMLIIGDLLFKSADFEYADEIAERLERMVPAEAKGDGPNPQVVHLQAQLNSQGELLNTLSRKLQEKELALQDKRAKIAEGAEQKVIDAYKAETDRLGALKDMLAADPEGVLMLVRRVINDTMDLPELGVAA
jgi:hypothetical protein